MLISRIIDTESAIRVIPSSVQSCLREGDKIVPLVLAIRQFSIVWKYCKYA